MARSLSDPDPDIRRRSTKPRVIFGLLNIALFVIVVWTVFHFAPATANRGLFLKLAGGGVILAMWATSRSMAWVFARYGRLVIAALVVAWAALAGWFILGL